LLFGFGGDHWDVALGFGGDRSDPELFGSGRDQCDRELAVQAWRGPLRSRSCCSGPAGTTLIRGLLFKSGRDHCNLALAVQVRRGPLSSWTTAITSLQLRSGGDHCEALANEVRQRRRTKRRRTRRRSTADIKPSKPHLTGKEKTCIVYAHIHIYICIDF